MRTVFFQKVVQLGRGQTWRASMSNQQHGWLNGSERHVVGHPVQGVTFGRWLSNEAASGSPESAVSSAGDGFLPPPPEISGVVDHVTALGEPTLASLGLGGFSPPGLVQTLLENIHVMADLPWYTSVIAMTVAIRTVALPITLMQLRNAANMHNHMPTMTKLQQQLLESQKRGDMGEFERISKELTDYTTRNNCNPLKMMARPLIAAPIFISVFYGLSAMAHLPVESLQTGGAYWFPNLNIPDPYCGLPALSALTVAAVTKTGVEGTSTTAIPPAMKFFMNAMPVVVFAFSSFQPAVLALYWSTSNILSLIFGVVFRTSYAKKTFNIPEMIKHPEPDAPSSSKTFRKPQGSVSEYSRLMQLNHEMEERRKVGALHFKDKTTPTSSQSDTKTSK